MNIELNEFKIIDDNSHNNLNNIFSIMFKCFFIIRAFITFFAVISIIFVFYYNSYYQHINNDNTYYSFIPIVIYLSLHICINVFAVLYINSKQKKNFKYNPIHSGLFFISLGIILYYIYNYLLYKNLIISWQS
jgi:hypothetical protein